MLYDHHRPSLARVRRVWAAVSETPNATVRELGATLDLSPVAVGAALQVLRMAGYIDFAPRSGRARTIIVPFVTIRARQGGTAV